MGLDIDLIGHETITVCPRCGNNFMSGDTKVLYSTNFTHNFVKMASEAGIYDCLWRPEENSFLYARNLIEPLQKGLDLLVSEPDRFKPFDTPSGWGTYQQFIPIISNLLTACQKYPNTKIEVSR